MLKFIYSTNEIKYNKEIIELLKKSKDIYFLELKIEFNDKTIDDNINKIYAVLNTNENKIILPKLIKKGTIMTHNNDQNNLNFVVGKFLNGNFKFFIDTGSTITIVKPHVISESTTIQKNTHSFTVNKKCKFDTFNDTYDVYIHELKI